MRSRSAVPAAAAAGGATVLMRAFYRCLAQRTQLHRAQAVGGGAGGVGAGIAPAYLRQRRLGVGLVAEPVLRQPQLQQRAGSLLVARVALQQRAELRLRQFVVLGGVVALPQPVQRVRGQRTLGELLQEVLELARGGVVLPGLQHLEGGLVGGALGVANAHRRRRRRVGRGGLGRRHAGLRRSGGHGRGAAFQPQQAAVDVEVLVARSFLHLLQRVLQFLDLPAQRLHLVLEQRDLAQQVAGALRRGRLLLQRGDPLGEARALRQRRRRQRQQRRAQREDSDSSVHRRLRRNLKTTKG